MAKKKYVLRPKLIKVDRYKVLPESYKEQDLKSYVSRWAKTSKIIFMPNPGFCGHGISIIIKTFFLKERNETTKSLYLSCLCCATKKEKDMLSIHLPDPNSKGDTCVELGGVLAGVKFWESLFAGIFSFKKPKAVIKI